MTTYPIKTTAIVSHVPKEGQLQWRKEELRLREPLEDELLVRIVATGVCPSDLRMSSLPPGVPGFSAYPKVLGHEGAGVVERAGSGVTHVKVGDKVLLSFDYCSKYDCRACVEETPGYCREFHAKNFFSKPDVYQSEDGTTAAGFFFGQSSFSKLALVKSTSALNVSQLVKDEEELKLFAPMGCGFQAGSAVITELAGVSEEDAITVSTRCGSEQSQWVVAEYSSIDLWTGHGRFDCSHGCESKRSKDHHRCRQEAVSLGSSERTRSYSHRRYKQNAFSDN
jgi:Zn-dependent alcohol dehydrogenase